MDWRNAKTLVTGGASFIGSHLVDALVAKGTNVRVVDNLSRGLLDNIRAHVDAGRVEFTQGDLNDPAVVEQAVRGVHVVAADHGGRDLPEPLADRSRADRVSDREPGRSAL
jgi:UDP-glucose 4-epimerase